MSRHAINFHMPVRFTLLFHAVTALSVSDPFADLDGEHAVSLEGGPSADRSPSRGVGPAVNKSFPPRRT